MCWLKTLDVLEWLYAESYTNRTYSPGSHGRGDCIFVERVWKADLSLFSRWNSSQHQGDPKKTYSAQRDWKLLRENKMTMDYLMANRPAVGLKSAAPMKPRNLVKLWADLLTTIIKNISTDILLSNLSTLTGAYLTRFITILTALLSINNAFLNY